MCLPAVTCRAHTHTHTHTHTHPHTHRWRLGELRTEGMTGDKVLPTDADLNAIEDAVAEVGADIQALDAFLLNAGKKFVMPGHPTYEYYRWRISLLQAPQLSRKKGHVTITVDDSAEKNTPVSVGQLLVLLAPLLENGQYDPGLFIDPNGHVVLPASIFEDKANEAQEY